MDSNKDENSTDEDLCETFQKRFLNLLNNDIDSDCEFIVGSQNIIIRGHRLLFSAASEVFHAMFYGELKEEKPVRIVDLDPEGFQGMRQYIYIGEVNFKSAINALLIYIAARKYLISPLIRKCINYLREKYNIQPFEVLEFYEICTAHNIPEFEESCYEIIQQQTDKVISSDYFLSIKPDTMELILKSPNLKLKSEVDVLLLFEKWVTAEAERRGIGVRKIMEGSINDLKKHIRFLTISSDDYFSKVACSPLLNSEEKVAIACNLEMFDSITMPESLSLERQLRNFNFPLKEVCYKHEHTFLVSIYNPCESSLQNYFTYNMKPLNLFKITYTPILEKFICFQVHITSVHILEAIELMTIRWKLEVLAKNKYDNIMFENKLYVVLDWKAKQEHTMVLTMIPINVLRCECFLKDNTVSILGSFHIRVDSKDRVLESL